VFTPLDIDSVETVSGDTTALSPLAAWRFSRKLVLNTTVSGAGVDEDIYDFPLLVRLDETVVDFGLFRTGGGDMRFARPGGAILPYEIELWDFTGKRAAVWVKVDTIFGNSDTQYVEMHWGNPNAAAMTSGATVFDTAAGYSGVWHFAPSDSFGDATWNANDGANAGSAGEPNSLIGEGRYGMPSQFNVAVPSSPSLHLQAPLTISGWARPDRPYMAMETRNPCIATNQYWSRNEGFMLGVYDQNNGYMGLRLLNGSSTGEVREVGIQVSDSAQWVHYAGSYDGQVMRVYRNGVEAASENAGSFSVNYIDSDLYLGVYMEGIIDEVRTERVLRPPAWIRLCCENQKPGQTLVTVE
jgi:hypothetical protein